MEPPLPSQEGERASPRKRGFSWLEGAREGHAPRGHTHDALPQPWPAAQGPDAHPVKQEATDIPGWPPQGSGVQQVQAMGDGVAAGRGKHRAGEEAPSNLSLRLDLNLELPASSEAGEAAAQRHPSAVTGSPAPPVGGQGHPWQPVSAASTRGTSNLLHAEERHAAEIAHLAEPSPRQGLQGALDYDRRFSSRGETERAAPSLTLGMDSYAAAHSAGTPFPREGPLPWKQQQQQQQEHWVGSAPSLRSPEAARGWAHERRERHEADVLGAQRPLQSPQDLGSLGASPRGAGERQGGLGGRAPRAGSEERYGAFGERGGAFGERDAGVGPGAEERGGGYGDRNTGARSGGRRGEFGERELGGGERPVSSREGKRERDRQGGPGERDGGAGWDSWRIPSHERERGELLSGAARGELTLGLTERGGGAPGDTKGTQSEGDEESSDEGAEEGGASKQGGGGGKASSSVRKIALEKKRRHQLT